MLAGLPPASRWALPPGSGSRTYRSQASDGHSGSGAHPQECSGAASLTVWAPAAKGAMGTLLPVSGSASPKSGSARGPERSLGRDSSPRERLRAAKVQPNG